MNLNMYLQFHYIATMLNRKPLKSLLRIILIVVQSSSFNTLLRLCGRKISFDCDRVDSIVFIPCLTSPCKSEPLVSRFVGRLSCPDCGLSNPSLLLPWSVYLLLSCCSRESLKATLVISKPNLYFLVLNHWKVLLMYFPIQFSNEIWIHCSGRIEICIPQKSVLNQIVINHCWF